MSLSAAPFAADFHARLQAREGTAWREAFTRLWPVALSAAGQILRQRGEAEDAASSALADLAAGSALPATWPALEALTAVIARRRAISLLRARNAAKRGAGETLSLDQLECEPAAASVAFAALDVATLLADIDPLRQRILKEHFIMGGRPRRSARVCNSSPPPCAVTCSAPSRNSGTRSAHPRHETIARRFATSLV